MNLTRRNPWHASFGVWLLSGSTALLRAVQGTAGLASPSCRRRVAFPCVGPPARPLLLLMDVGLFPVWGWTKTSMIMCAACCVDVFLSEEQKGWFTGSVGAEFHIRNHKTLLPTVHSHHGTFQSSTPPRPPPRWGLLAFGYFCHWSKRLEIFPCGFNLMSFFCGVSFLFLYFHDEWKVLSTKIDQVEKNDP